MRFIRFNWSALRLVRFLVAVCVCALLVLSNAFPAYSASGNISPQPTSSSTPRQQGEANLLDIEKEAQEATQTKPYSREETQSKANPGLNEIQGTGDAEQMSRPENAKGNSVEDKSKDFLERLNPFQ